MWLIHMKHLLTLYSSCAPLIDQRSNRVTGVISGLKLYDFLSPELNWVETFHLNWNNAFCRCTCVFFYRDRRSLRGSIGQICQNSPIHGICHWLSRARAVAGWETKIKLSMGSNWMGDHIKLSMGSNWMGDHIRSSIASNWMGDHTSPII